MPSAVGRFRVELHGISTCLIPTFLYERHNQRTDDYGGTAENRARFPPKVIDALVDT
ncbi:MULTISPECIES: hypothetical protein [unclassified Rhizobium]|uniref:oxidoreductase n=1 Tax=unclassified Rhizobium TaxID=2613769 RepID=UPI00216782CB|nr:MULTISPECIES: hypothetical protein [unclassified Rhizobium]